MRVFASLEEMVQAGYGEPRWRLAAQAIRDAPDLAPGVAYSRGDSVTFWRESGPVRDEDCFVAHRRYLEVIHVLRGRLEVQCAPVAALRPVCDYRDSTDRERLEGAGAREGVPAGATAVVAINEGVRRMASPGAIVVTAHVTVEGATGSPPTS